MPLKATGLNIANTVTANTITGNVVATLNQYNSILNQTLSVESLRTASSNLLSLNVATVIGVANSGWQTIGSYDLSGLNNLIITIGAAKDIRFSWENISSSDGTARFLRVFYGTSNTAWLSNATDYIGFYTEYWANTAGNDTAVTTNDQYSTIGTPISPGLQHANNSGHGTATVFNLQTTRPITVFRSESFYNQDQRQTTGWFGTGYPTIYQTYTHLKLAYNVSTGVGTFDGGYFTVEARY